MLSFWSWFPSYPPSWIVKELIKFSSSKLYFSVDTSSPRPSHPTCVFINQPATPFPSKSYNRVHTTAALTHNHTVLPQDIPPHSIGTEPSMYSVPPGFSSLRLPLGEFVLCPTGRPGILTLVRLIAPLGYLVQVYFFPRNDLRALPLGDRDW